MREGVAGANMKVLAIYLLHEARVAEIAIDGLEYLLMEGEMADKWKPETDSEGEPVLPEAAIFQAVGSASMCWESVEKAGVFDSDQAKVIAEGLIDYLQSTFGLKIRDAWWTPKKPKGHGWEPLV